MTDTATLETAHGRFPADSCRHQWVTTRTQLATPDPWTGLNHSTTTACVAGCNAVQ